MKFNRIVEPIFNRNVAQPVNYEGAQAYTLTPEMELYAAVATTMLNDSYYEKADARLDRLKHCSIRQIQYS